MVSNNTDSNNNYLFKRGLSKGEYKLRKYTKMVKYIEDKIKIADWMNHYPRKSLNYKTPLEAVLEEFNDKSIINKIYKLQESVNTI